MNTHESGLGICLLLCLIIDQIRPLAKEEVCALHETAFLVILVDVSLDPDALEGLLHFGRDVPAIFGHHFLALLLPDGNLLGI